MECEFGTPPFHLYFLGFFFFIENQKLSVFGLGHESRNKEEMGDGQEVLISPVLLPKDC